MSMITGALTVRIPTGETPPAGYPVISRTNSGSASFRDSGADGGGQSSPIDSSGAVGDRDDGEPVLVVTKTTVLMICSTGQPTASAASGTVGIGAAGRDDFGLDPQALERSLDSGAPGRFGSIMLSALVASDRGHRAGRRRRN